MRKMGESERDTDFDSLFITDEADQNALVAKQQLSYVTSRPGSGPIHDMKLHVATFVVNN